MSERLPGLPQTLKQSRDKAAEALADIENEQRMKDELDAEVTKKIEKQLGASLPEDDDEDYEDDEFQQELKEDTIKTEKIEALVEEEMMAKVRASQDIDNLEVKVAQQQPDDVEEDEYSFHDEDTKSNPKDDVAPGQHLEGSDIEEDYEF